jgi:hypothetical protein
MPQPAGDAGGKPQGTNRSWLAVTFDAGGGNMRDNMKAETHDHHSLILLISLLFFLVLSAFVRDDWTSEVVVALAMFAILVLAILKVSNKRRPWTALLLAASSLLVTLISIFNPTYTLRIANWLLLSLFFGYVSVALFSYLERAGAINRAKLDACLGLYLILGMFYYAIFNLMQEVRPGSFMEVGPTPVPASRHSLLYFSLASLTTVGYGDVTAVSRPARMIATLEAVTGVFYVAVTVARLVSGYQQKDRERA